MTKFDVLMTIVLTVFAVVALVTLWALWMLRPPPPLNHYMTDDCRPSWWAGRCKTHGGLLRRPLDSEEN